MVVRPSSPERQHSSLARKYAVARLAVRGATDERKYAADSTGANQGGSPTALRETA
jgi:hypothetical protein